MPKVYKVFNLNPVCEVSGFKEDQVVVVAASSRKCSLCHHRWLCCKRYGEHEVCKSEDVGLDQIRATLLDLFGLRSYST